MGFGTYVNDLRINNKKTLRQFCAESGLNPSYWSKIERGVNPPPENESVLGQWAKYFELESGTEGWNRFMDEARTASSEFPKEIMSDEKAVSLLPVFIRNVRGAEMGKAQIKKMIQMIKSANTPDESDTWGQLCDL
jgi:transcriptional regulator with XRE-family HTH domain